MQLLLLLLLLILLLLIKDLLNKMELSTSRIAADDDMVQLGFVVHVEKDGNDRADEAADMGRIHVRANIMNAPTMFF